METRVVKVESIRIDWKNFEQTEYFQAIKKTAKDLKKDGLDGEEAMDKVSVQFKLFKMIAYVLF